MLYSQLKIFFENVSIAKPASSRNSSIEAFVVCQCYRPPEGFESQIINPLTANEIQIDNGNEVNKVVLPFVACGDLRGYDSDMSYKLNVSQIMRFELIR